MMRIWILTAVLIGGVLMPGQAQEEKINWVSFEEALALNKTNQKKFFIDFYTNWCGWCKRLDQVTFVDPEVVSLINEYYYPIKFNAEGQDTIQFGAEEYVFVKPPNSRRGYHELAATIMQGQMSYPTMVILQINEAINQVEIITPIKGFLDGDKLEPILQYLGQDLHLQQVDWEEFRAKYSAKTGE